MRQPSRDWVLVLAAGEGSRLRSLSAISGGHVPKQFCSFCSDRSLLAHTLERAERLVPRERIVVVVASQHRDFWESELSGLPAGNVIVQPRNKGTAAGLLLGALAVLQRDPYATLVILPSDHFIEDEDALLEALRRALVAAARRPRAVVLLGIAPEEPDTEYGWVVPEPGTDQATSGVRAFVEKPGALLAVQLMEQGALWSSFIMVGHLDALLSLYEHTQPALLAGFLACLARPPGSADGTEELYASLPVRDFSRDVLQARTETLRVLRVPALGWSDLGTPQRLARCLARIGGARRQEAARSDASVAGDAPGARVRSRRPRSLDRALAALALAAVP